MGTKGGEGSAGEGEDGEGNGRAVKRVRREGGGEGMNGSAVGGESGDGHEQLLMGEPYPDGNEEGEDEDYEAPDEGGEDADEDDANESRRREQEDEDEDKDEEGEEEEDDDDDEYPDEGRRLSSVEREAHEGRSPRNEEGGSQGVSADEELSDVSD